MSESRVGGISAEKVWHRAMRAVMDIGFSINDAKDLGAIVIPLISEAIEAARVDVMKEVDGLLTSLESEHSNCDPSDCTRFSDAQDVVCEWLRRARAQGKD